MPPKKPHKKNPEVTGIRHSAHFTVMTKIKVLVIFFPAVGLNSTPPPPHQIVSRYSFLLPSSFYWVFGIFWCKLLRWFSFSRKNTLPFFPSRCWHRNLKHLSALVSWWTMYWGWGNRRLCKKHPLIPANEARQWIWKSLFSFGKQKPERECFSATFLFFFVSGYN